MNSHPRSLKADDIRKRESPTCTSMCGSCLLETEARQHAAVTRSSDKTLLELSSSSTISLKSACSRRPKRKGTRSNDVTTISLWTAMSEKHETPYCEIARSKRRRHGTPALKPTETNFATDGFGATTVVGIADLPLAGGSCW